MCDIKKELKKYDKLKKRIKVLESIIKFEDDQKRTKKLENEIISIRFQLNVLNNLIKELPEKERKIIKYRYINKYSWAKICTITGDSERGIRYKMNNGIKKIDFIFNKYGYIV